jgi:hypothetical protein
MFARVNHASLLCQSKNYAWKKFYKIWRISQMTLTFKKSSKILFFRKKNIFGHCKKCKHPMFYLKHMKQVISSQLLLYTPVNITSGGDTKVSTITFNITSLSISTFSITSFTITTCNIQHFIATQSIMPFCLLSFWWVSQLLLLCWVLLCRVSVLITYKISYPSLISKNDIKSIT